MWFLPFSKRSQLLIHSVVSEWFLGRTTWLRMLSKWEGNFLPFYLQKHHREENAPVRTFVWLIPSAAKMMGKWSAHASMTSCQMISLASAVSNSLLSQKCEKFIACLMESIWAIKRQIESWWKVDSIFNETSSKLLNAWKKEVTKRTCLTWWYHHVPFTLRVALQGCSILSISSPPFKKILPRDIYGKYGIAIQEIPMEARFMRILNFLWDSSILSSIDQLSNTHFNQVLNSMAYEEP